MDIIWLLVVVAVILALFSVIGGHGGWYGPRFTAGYGYGGGGLILLIIVLILLFR